jgi:hypothetical protein
VSSRPPRLTDVQRVTLRALLQRGSSDYLTFFEERGLPSLERRGLVVQRGGRRPQGRGALRVLSAEGERVASLVAAARMVEREDGEA